MNASVCLTGGVFSQSSDEEIRQHDTEAYGEKENGRTNSWEQIGENRQSWKDKIQSSRFYAEEEPENATEVFQNLPIEFLEQTDVDQKESEWPRVVVTNDEMRKLWFHGERR